MRSFNLSLSPTASSPSPKSVLPAPPKAEGQQEDFANVMTAALGRPSRSEEPHASSSPRNPANNLTPPTRPVRNAKGNQAKSITDDNTGVDADSDDTSDLAVLGKKITTLTIQNSDTGQNYLFLAASTIPDAVPTPISPSPNGSAANTQSGNCADVIINEMVKNNAQAGDSVLTILPNGTQPASATQQAPDSLTPETASASKEASTAAPILLPDAPLKGRAPTKTADLKDGEKASPAKSAHEALTDQIPEVQSTTATASSEKSQISHQLEPEITLIQAKKAQQNALDSSSAASAVQVNTSSDKAYGISAAQQTETMKKAAKMNGSSESAEQNLPVGQNPVPGMDATVHEKSAVGTNFPHSRAEISNALDTALLDARSTSAPGILSLETISAARSKESLTMVERTGEMIVQNALRTGPFTDSLRVVIKPGGDVQMSLDLQQRNGGVDVQATVQRGDFELLSRHWPQLQEQMEARGVRLAPLASADNFTTGNQSQNFQQQKSTPRDEESVPFAPGSLAFTGALPTPEIVRQTSTTGRRGWESWA